MMTTTRTTALAGMILALVVLTGATGASADRAGRDHCDARTVGGSIWLLYGPTIYKNTVWGALDLPEGTKLRVDARAEGYDANFPDPGPVGMMYRLARIVGSSTATPQPGELWLVGSWHLEVTPQFERCAARLPLVPTSHPD